MMGSNRSASFHVPLAKAASAGLLAALLLSLFFAPAALPGDDPPTGREIYQNHCVACHGENGEGVEDICEPLHGDLSLDELTKVIDETMPEDEPEAVIGPEARRVAEYIYGAFYSPQAREQKPPKPRIELVRLTARQYEQTVADLIASFTGRGNLDEKRGLTGHYFSAKWFPADKKVIERLDGPVVFRFNADNPDTQTLASEEFSIWWEGSLIVDRTGQYGFCVDTPNAIRLWINGNEEPLIDAWVRSGDQTEHRASIRLLGGRTYPIRLEYLKAKEDSAAAVALRWQPPDRVEQAIPGRNLSPAWSPPVLVVETPFPADDASAGYERGVAVSEAWDEAVTYAAIETAGKVIDRLEALSNVKADAADRPEQLKQFACLFVERAFRRPLTDEQKQLFVDTQFAAVADPAEAVKRAVLLALKSPRFLYVGVEGNRVDDYTAASRLALGLWDSLPDEALLRAAAEGRLRTEEQVAAEARRMLPDRRTHAKLNEFFLRWLRLDGPIDISKDPAQYPGFDAALLSDLQTSLDLFLEEVVWGDASDYRQLLLADWLYANRRMGEFYGIPGTPETGFARIALDPRRQAGLLTHPLVTANFAYYKSSSPIHRGVFLLRGVLGRPLKPPPIAVTPQDEGVHPEWTTRQRVTAQTSPAACQTCHGMINPLGFALENFDTAGRFREQEKDLPIDATGSYTASDGTAVAFDGPRALAEFLAASEDSHRAMVRQVFHHTVKQPIDAYGEDTLDRLRQGFVEDDYNIQKLLVRILAATALKTNGPE